MFIDEYVEWVNDRNRNNVNGVLAPVTAQMKRNIIAHLWTCHTFPQADEARRVLAQWTRPSHVIFHKPDINNFDPGYTILLVLPDGKRFLSYFLSPRSSAEGISILLPDDSYHMYDDGILISRDGKYEMLRPATDPVDKYITDHKWWDHSADAFLIGARFISVYKPADEEPGIAYSSIKRMLCLNN